MSGVLKYDVKIVSTDFTESSPIAVWTLNLLTCDQKKNDWITPKSPVGTFNFDKQNPPTSTLVTTFNYLGPKIESCGNPAVIIAD